MPSSHPEPASARVAVVPPEALEVLAAEWDGLWRRCPEATAFQSPHWLLPWMRHYAPGRTWAVALRIGDRLAGLAPVFVWEGALLLAGTGPSDRGGSLLEPGAAHFADRLLEALPRTAGGAFDRIDLQQLSPDERAAGGEIAGWDREVCVGAPCLVAPLEGPDGLGALSARRRANWAYAVRRLEREGATIGLADLASVREAMGDLIRLHRKRWRDRGGSEALAEPRLADFLGDAARSLAGAGLLRLWELRLGGSRIAVLLVLAGRRSHAYYLGGFDPDHDRMSPSAALIGAAMRGAQGEGAVAFDFLRGDEPYKTQWGAVECPTERRVFRRRASASPVQSVASGRGFFGG